MASNSTTAQPGRLALGLTLFALACLVLAPAAFAEVYHLELVNGEQFDSRHPPQEASWDRDLILFHTETGNWSSVRREELARVTIETELRGYGQRINATTIYMGQTANSAPIPGTEQAPSSTDQLLQALYDQSQQTYSVDQFVEPGEAGGGIPVGFTQSGTVPPPSSIQVPVPQN